MMKSVKLFLAFCVTILCVASAFSQYKFEGVVVEVADGKTVVIDLGQSKRLIAELQGIEVPEPEQELHVTVVEHLQKLLLGKQVQFYPGGWTLPKIKGQLVSSGVDVSQQMLRDGAAWYAPGGRLDYEHIYKTSEAQAKMEKRGVWAVKNLKPAWEFRLEKEAVRIKKQKEEEERLAQEEEKNTKARYAAAKNKSGVSAEQASQKLGIELWDFNLPIGNGLDLIYKYNEAANRSLVSTPLMMSVLQDGKVAHQVIFAAGYGFDGQEIKKGGGVFRIAVGDVSTEKDFLRRNGVSVYTAKNQKLNFGKAEIRVTKDAEVAVYTASRRSLEQLAAADEPVLHIGKHRKVLDKTVLNVLRKILDATE